MIEYDRERERRERPFPNDLRKVLIEKDGSILSRAIGREESEMVRHANAILPFASMTVYLPWKCSGWRTCSRNGRRAAARTRSIWPGSSDGPMDLEA
jgi:hypothetical protein